MKTCYTMELLSTLLRDTERLSTCDKRVCLVLIGSLRLFNQSKLWYYHSESMEKQYQYFLCKHVFGEFVNEKGTLLQGSIIEVERPDGTWMNTSDPVDASGIDIHMKLLGYVNDDNYIQTIQQEEYNHCILDSDEAKRFITGGEIEHIAVQTNWFDVKHVNTDDLSIDHFFAKDQPIVGCKSPSQSMIELSGFITDAYHDNDDSSHPMSMIVRIGLQDDSTFMYKNVRVSAPLRL